MVGAVPKLLESRVAAHIEKGRVAMRRLEEISAVLKISARFGNS